ncbi:hypothetical protein [Paramicrobacterium chengjingii]|uniref:LapA family protein n=1 Tax=Paramicrobacterium chengjingii TaxID=2769067 RepID=A0ABX6YGF9_9MICO|nr:hypothetical protein [Microbacterium chengjingii]QPZ37699.1 LapA family protein [Microbacterium chengjingii]
MSESGEAGGFKSLLATTNWIALVLVVLVIVFMVQNSHDANLTFLWVTVRWPLWLAIGIVLVLSFAAGFLFRGRRDKRRRSRR